MEHFIMSTYKTYIKGWPTKPGTYDISEILDVKPGISINLTSSRFVYNEKFPEGRLKSNVIGILLSMSFPTDYVWKGFPTDFDEAIEEAIDDQIEATMQQEVNDNLEAKD
jgi:hypothetical protein